MIQGFKAGRLSARERAEQLIRRPWTRRERAVVINGFLGRCCIAIEPVLCATMFLALTIGTLIVRTDPMHPDEHNMVILSPIFGLGTLAFMAYAFAVMLAPTRALLHSYRPIFIVDGYVRYRPPDDASPVDSNGYVAVLTEDGWVACEWPTLGHVPLPSLTSAALTEFTEYGGVHRIDGRSTGVLPETFARFGVSRYRGHREIIS